SAIVRAEQHEEAQRTQERLQGHWNAMAIRLGELQARMMRLDGVGERLASIAGLKPQELSALLSRTSPGTGGAISSQPSHTLSVDEFTALIDRLAGQVEARS